MSCERPSPPVGKPAEGRGLDMLALVCCALWGRVCQAWLPVREKREAQRRGSAPVGGEGGVPEELDVCREMFRGLGLTPQQALIAAMLAQSGRMRTSAVISASRHRRSRRISVISCGAPASTAARTAVAAALRRTRPAASGTGGRSGRDGGRRSAAMKKGGHSGVTASFFWYRERDLNSQGVATGGF